MIPEMGRLDGGGRNADAHGVTSSTREGDTAFAQTIAAIEGDVAVEDRIEQLVPGAAVGRYVVLAKLGAGGMGEVFAAYDPELDRKVALKLLNHRVRLGGAGGASEARARLIREAQVLAKLNHPNIVAVHDAGEHRGAVWIAMEYVEGEALSAWLRRRRRSWHEVLAVMTPAARGLVAAHDAGLIHRDIKPDNIMVSTDGRVRVMDLGLARMLDSDNPSLSTGRHEPPAKRSSDNHAAGVTRAGALVGTPAYMSPEQFQGLRVDFRTDIFSYCATLWEALMGGA